MVTLHQRVAGRKLADRELVRQHRVLYRSEQRRDDAEQSEGDKQKRHRMQEEAERGKTGCEDFGELQPPRDHRLHIFVGEFAAEARKDEEGKDEDRQRNRHQRITMRGGRAVEQDDDERVLEYVVVECRAELGPEQRREAA